MAELLTDEIIIEKLNEDGIMQEPDGPWLLEYIYENYGGQLDTTSDFVDDKWTLKIYSEMTYDINHNDNIEIFKEKYIGVILGITNIFY